MDDTLAAKVVKILSKEMDEKEEDCELSSEYPLPLNGNLDTEGLSSRQPPPYEVPRIVTHCSSSADSTALNRFPLKNRGPVYDQNFLNPQWRPCRSTQRPHILVNLYKPSPPERRIAFHEFYAAHIQEPLHSHWQPAIRKTLPGKEVSIEHPEVVLFEEPEDFDSLDCANILKVVYGGRKGSVTT